MKAEKQSTIERAFELARSGSFHSVEALSKRLNSEGYSDSFGQLSGPSIRKQLRGMMKAAKLAPQASD